MMLALISLLCKKALYLFSSTIDTTNATRGLLQLGTSEEYFYFKKNEDRVPLYITMYLWLAWNLLCRPLWAQRDLPDSASHELE